MSAHLIAQNLIDQLKTGSGLLTNQFAFKYELFPKQKDLVMRYASLYLAVKKVRFQHNMDSYRIPQVASLLKIKIEL